MKINKKIGLQNAAAFTEMIYKKSPCRYAKGFRI